MEDAEPTIPTTRRYRHVSSLQQILSFSLGTSEAHLAERLLQFDELIQTYEETSAVLEEVSDSVKKTLVTQGVPEPLRSHLRLVGYRRSYPEVRAIVEEWLLSKRAFQHSVPEVSLVNPADLRSRNREQTLTQGWNETQLARLCALGLSDEEVDETLLWLSADFGRKGKGFGKGAQNQQRFQGACRWCWRLGHMARDCRQRLAEQKGKGKGKSWHYNQGQHQPWRQQQQPYSGKGSWGKSATRRLGSGDVPMPQARNGFQQPAGRGRGSAMKGGGKASGKGFPRKGGVLELDEYATPPTDE